MALWLAVIIAATHVAGPRGAAAQPAADVAVRVTNPRWEQADADVLDVTWDIRVTANPPGTGVSYELLDELLFRPGMTVVEWTATSAAGTANPLWDGTASTTLTDGPQQLPDDGTAVWSVAMQVHADPIPDGEDPYGSNECSFGEEDRSALRTRVTVVHAAGQARDEGCDSLPVSWIDLHGYRHAPVDNGDGTVTMTRTIWLNDYSDEHFRQLARISDALVLPPGVVLQSAEAATPDGEANAGYDGFLDTVVATVITSVGFEPEATVQVVLDITDADPASLDCVVEADEDTSGLVHDIRARWLDDEQGMRRCDPIVEPPEPTPTPTPSPSATPTPTPTPSPTPPPTGDPTPPSTPTAEPTASDPGSPTKSPPTDAYDGSQEIDGATDGLAATGMPVAAWLLAWLIATLLGGIMLRAGRGR